MKILSIIIFSSLSLTYLFVGLGLRLGQNRLIFMPSFDVQTTPKDLKMSYEDVYIKVSENQSIHGWWIPSRYPSEKVILQCHGNGFNISHNLGQSRIFYELGFSIFIFDYRGYGLSKGDFPREKQAYKDVEFAWNYLTKTRKIKPENIIVYGHSLGGAIAIDLAYNISNVKGLIIEASFTSMKDMTKYIGYDKWFPIDLILTEKFDSLSKLQNIDIPILFIHGELDQTVPSWMGEKLYEVAKQPKELFLVTEADHNNVATVSGSEYLDIIRDFMNLLSVSINK